LGLAPSQDDTYSLIVTLQRKIGGVWLLVFAAFAAGFVIGRPWSMAIGGLAVTTFALAIVANVGGLADAMPRRTGVGPFWREQSPATTRLTFGLFAFIGALVFVTGLVRLLT
jgi:hypothetical protein